MCFYGRSFVSILPIIFAYATSYYLGLSFIQAWDLADPHLSLGLLGGCARSTFCHRERLVGVAIHTRIHFFIMDY